MISYVADEHSFLKSIIWLFFAEIHHFHLTENRLYRINTMKGDCMTLKGMSLLPEQKRLSDMLKALGNPIRFQIVEFLAQKKVCITSNIVDATPLAQSTVSQHLKVLREAGLIRGEIEGPAISYCLDTENIRWLKEQLRRWLPDYS